MHTKNYILILMTVVICLSLNGSVFGEENVNSRRPNIYEVDGSEREMTDAEIDTMQQINKRLIEEGYDLRSLPLETVFDLRKGEIYILNPQTGKETVLSVNLEQKNTSSPFNEQMPTDQMPMDNSFYDQEQYDNAIQDRENEYEKNVFQALEDEDSDEHFTPITPRNSNVRQALAGESSSYGFSDGNVYQAIAGEDLLDFKGCGLLTEGLLPQDNKVIKDLAKGMDAILKKMKKSLPEGDENNKNLLEEMNIIRNLLEKNLDEDPNNDIHLTTLSRLIERFKKLEFESFVELKKHSEPND